MSKLIIISPSGNLYGSENVLIDYLQATKKNHTIYIPAKSSFYDYAKDNLKNKHIIKSYNSLPLLYAIVYFKVLFNYNLYINEAGHIKWLALISKLIPKRKYTVHVRLIEDTNKSRLNFAKSKNISIVSTSQFISKSLSIENTVIYDNYAFNNREVHKNNIQSIKKVGIIGRITETKGFYSAIFFIKHLLNKNSDLIFYFFGDIDSSNTKISDTIEELKNSYGERIIFTGFLSEKSIIYNTIDIVMHFNPNEALGRIYLEAIDYFKPFYSFNSGGIAEIGKICELSNNLVDYREGWEIELAQKILELNLEREYAKLVKAKNKAMETFSVFKYTVELENIIL